MADPTYQYATLAQRTRWAYETISEVATTLLELDRKKLAANAFSTELAIVELHNDLVKLLRDAPQLTPRKDATRRPSEDLPF